ncbi:MAG: Cache 3/Cache 2 fusion domain-containing protein [Bacteriovorax sp.]|nr:Cache 3/Cache 2 fusion domain-containing protein [Bacteriovorax sp.]
MKSKIGFKLRLLLLSVFVGSNVMAAGDPIASVAALKAKLTSKGTPKIEGTHKIGDKEAPGLKFGAMNINTNENAVVDSIKDKLGGICTIFVRTGEDFIRISTNALDKDGKRCMGTLLKNPGPAYSAIKAGNSYTGEADVCGTIYKTYYEPLKIADKIEGIYFCGYKKE